MLCLGLFKAKEAPRRLRLGAGVQTGNLRHWGIPSVMGSAHCPELAASRLSDDRLSSDPERTFGDCREQPREPAVGPCNGHTLGRRMESGRSSERPFLEVEAGQAACFFVALSFFAQ